MRLLGLILCFGAGAAQAQGVLISRSTTASPTRTDTARYYIATATTGSAFTCNAQLASCIDLGPGSCDALGTTSGGSIRVGGEACAPTLLIGGGGNVTIKGAGIDFVNAGVDFGNNTALQNTYAGKPVWFNEESGILLQPFSSASLPECGTGGAPKVPEGTHRMVAAAGASATRFCLCIINGAAAYEWRNLLDPATTGTATTCPATP